MEARDSARLHAIIMYYCGNTLIHTLLQIMLFQMGRTHVYPNIKASLKRLLYYSYFQSNQCFEHLLDTFLFFFFMPATGNCFARGCRWQRLERKVRIERRRWINDCRLWDKWLPIRLWWTRAMSVCRLYSDFELNCKWYPSAVGTMEMRLDA